MTGIKKFLKISIGRLANPKWVIGNDEIPIFMFHRVLDSVHLDQYLDKSIYLSKPEFEKIIVLINEYFDILCLKGLLEGKVRAKKRSCIVTFDDGWIDNYQVALHILKKYSVPATIFLPTGFVGTSKKFWFDRLSDVISSQVSIEKKFIEELITMIPGSVVVNDFDIKKEKLYFHICSILKKKHQREIDNIIDILEEEFLPVGYDKDVRSIMNWDEVLEMSNENISFGSHGVTHSIFTQLSRSEKKFEINQSRCDLLKTKINYVNCLSFPNGNYDQESLNLATSAGYSLFFSASINKCGEGKSVLLAHRNNMSADNLEKNILFFSLLKAKLKKRLFNVKQYEKAHPVFSD